ncbi:hypothetical protein, partial [Mesorhizobium sp. M0011]|uniref:hypothetical protein n=1 Tax=Mesorhizobium sp. M0011 TaxID=2956839 RepID=UPI003335263F
QHGRPARAQEARSTPSRMTSFMIAHFAELDAHNPEGCRKPTQQQTSWLSDMESVTPRPE